MWKVILNNASNQLKLQIYSELNFRSHLAFPEKKAN